jgi:hypothetical protein
MGNCAAQYNTGELFKPRVKIQPALNLFPFDEGYLCITQMYIHKVFEMYLVWTSCTGGHPGAVFSFPTVHHVTP